MRRRRLLVGASFGALAVAAAAGFAFVTRRHEEAARGIEPAVAVSAGGGAVIAWMRVPAGADAADAIGVRSGDGPDAYVRSPGGRFAADPAIVARPNGGFVLTWLGFRARPHEEPHDMRVFAAVRAPGPGSAFGAPVLVTDDAPDHEYDRPSSAVTSRGAVVVAYRSGHRGDAGITVAKSTDGSSWRRTELFARFQFAGGLPAVCAARDADRVYVTYYDPTAGIMLRASHDGGESFSDEERVSADGESVALEGPLCVASGDEVVVGYGISSGPIDTGSSPLLSALALARSRDGGRTFDARASLAEPGRPLLHPRMARLDDGTLGILAYAGRELRFFRTGFGGRTKSAVLLGDVRVAPRRSDPAWGGDYIGLAVEGSRAWAAYVAARPIPRVALLAFTP